MFKGIAVSRYRGTTKKCLIEHTVWVHAVWVHAVCVLFGVPAV